MGRWAKNHDQRKGQWLVNYIRESVTCIGHGMTIEKIIELTLWNMTNEEFESIMERYYD